VLTGSAAVPAVHADRLRIAEATGAEAVRLTGSELTPDRIVTRESLDNALKVLLAIGGSTNAVIHLAAIAGRVGLPIDLHHLNALSASTPVLVNLKPTGQHYMEDFHAAGGVGAVLHEMKPQLNLDCRSVTGETLAERLRDRPEFVDRQVIRSAAGSVPAHGRLAGAVWQHLRQNGAILKRAAATSGLFEHEGRAVVFKDWRTSPRASMIPPSTVLPEDVSSCRTRVPIGAGMHEAGYLPIQPRLARAGVKDMVRIIDARMSGTAFGTVDSQCLSGMRRWRSVGLVRSGDRIRVSVKGEPPRRAACGGELEGRRSDCGRAHRASPRLCASVCRFGARGRTWMRLRFFSARRPRRRRLEGSGRRRRAHRQRSADPPSPEGDVAAMDRMVMTAMPTSADSQMPRYSVSAFPGCAVQRDADIAAHGQRTSHRTAARPCWRTRTTRRFVATQIDSEIAAGINEKRLTDIPSRTAMITSTRSP
jgi:hypothetical protein